jgi:hypothetical protein
VLKRKDFWVGFLVAYVLAVFLPPSKLLGGMKGGS